MDYSEVLAKMREIAERDGLDVQGPEAEARLLEAATKELEAEKGHDCEGEGCKGHECEGKQCEKCAKCRVARMTARSRGFNVAQVGHETKCHKGPVEKCSACMPDPPYNPLAGATSFAEADSYEEANKLENHIREQEYLFRKISDNIFASEELSLAEKLAKVKAAATELEGRLEKPADEKGLVERLKGLLWPQGDAEAIAESWALTDKATKKEDGKDFPAKDYAYVPDATKPSTWKLRLTSTPGGKPDARIVGAAVAALGKGFRGQKVQIPAAALAGVKAKVRAAWRKANPDKKAEDMPAAIKEAVGGFRVFKDAKGAWRWVTLTSNKWRDRDGEIIPAAAHEENVAYAESAKDMPELRLWHVPGSRVGVADWTDFAHGFLLHSGGFDKGMEGVAKSLAASEEPLGVSHGFYYEMDEGSDTYRSYRDFEVSVLPLEKAANPWTEFTVDNTKEVAMGLTDERRGFLVEHMGEGQVAALEKLLEEKEQDLKDGKVDFKEVLADALEATPAPDPKPVEGKGEGEGDDAITKLVAGVEALAGKVGEIATAQAEQAETIKALKATDDEKIAALMHPTRQPPPDGERPTEDKDNQVDPKDKGIDPATALDPERLEKTPGGKGLKQILQIK